MYSLRLKILIVGVVVASGAALGFAYLRTSTGGDQGDAVERSGNSTTHQQEGVEGVYPSEGAQVLQQERVGVDLVSGWNGELTIDDQTIPEAELTRSSPRQSADRLEFAPGPDKVMSELPSGRVCARARVWQRSAGPEGGSSTIDWCFTVI